MRTIYLLTRKNQEFCRSIEQLKGWLFLNDRFSSVTETTAEADGNKVTYKISLIEVEATGETVFQIEVTAEQENDDDKAKALDSFDSALLHTNKILNIFQVNTVLTEASMYYGRRLYPEISELESLLREIIYLFMIKKVGSEWVKKGAPQKLSDELAKGADKNNLGGIPVADPLMYADFITLLYFFMDRYPLCKDSGELFKQLKNKENLSEDKMAELIEQYEPKSNWERYFSEKLPITDFSKKWQKLYCYRNCVAHTRKITGQDYNGAKKIIDELKPRFTDCLENIDDVKLTREQAEAVEEVARKTIAPSRVRVDVPMTYSANSAQILAPISSSLLTVADVAQSLTSQVDIGNLSNVLLTIPDTDRLTANMDNLERVINPFEGVLEGLFSQSDAMAQTMTAAAEMAVRMTEPYENIVDYV